MANLVLIFATGLTTGGLSCLAVQGGMLASSLAEKTEDKLADLAGEKRGDTYDRELANLKSRGLPKKVHARAILQLKHQHPVLAAEKPKTAHMSALAKPIILFLVAKLVAYTILGFALGWLGSVLQLSVMMRAVLQITIGIFMLGTGLRLLNVHPIFRHFVIEPPKFVTRYIRRTTKQADGNWLAPTFLGALTVLIPCGITQAMMALAVASGNPVSGALILFAFVLGTTPLFFTLTYLATKLGSRWQNKFWKVTGVVVLGLGLLAIDSGLALSGSRFSSVAIRQALASVRADSQSQLAGSQDQNTPAAVATASNELTMNITDQAYTPEVMNAKAGEPIKLTVKTSNVQGCGRSLVIPSLNLQKSLEATDSQEIVLPSQSAGTIRITCIMGMYNSTIVVK